jgi:AraC-like DNA-binding protein
MALPTYLCSEMAKVPVIEQCSVSNTPEVDVLVEDLAGYLHRNKNLIFPHRHNFYHFVLFTQGEGNYSIDFETYEVEPWQIYFMSPGQIHTWSFQGNMDGYVVNFDKDLFKTMLLHPDYFEGFSFLSSASLNGVFVVEKESRAIVLSVLKRLQQNVQDNTFVQASLLYLFHILEQQQRVSSNSLGANSYSHTLLRNYLHLIELNYKSLRLPKDYAALLYITPNHLNALSKEQLGISAGELIRNRIILEAKRLLAIKDYSIAEIAYELSFADNSYFTKFFKKIEGVTPEEFRKNTIRNK